MSTALVMFHAELRLCEFYLYVVRYNLLAFARDFFRIEVENGPKRFFKLFC